MAFVLKRMSVLDDIIACEDRLVRCQCLRSGNFLNTLHPHTYKVKAVVLRFQLKQLLMVYKLKPDLETLMSKLN